MPIVRAQAEFTHDSGLPRDKVVNTFHFEVPDLSDTALNNVADKVAKFYNNDPGVSQTHPLQNYISTAIATTGHKVKVYDLGTPGSPPEYEYPFDFLSRSPVGIGSGNAPAEVSVCLSFRNESVVAVTPPRRRGRIYFPPIRNGATDFNDDTEPAPSSAFRTDLVNAGDTLRTSVAALGATYAWVIWSPTEGLGFDVERCWVDNAFDTMRKRGIRATARTWLPAL